MSLQGFVRTVWVLSATVLVVALLAACGSSAKPASGSSGSGTGADATTLLHETFTGSHKVTSGNLHFSLTVVPSGSSVVTGPITLSFSGPFQSQGNGRLPESNFTVTISAQGQTGSLSIISAGGKGYVTASGASYAMPQATFDKLESGLSTVAKSGGGSTGDQSSLEQLGIDPLDWLSNPTVVGIENVGGVETTHIRAGINVSALLHDVSKLLADAGSLTIAGTTKIPNRISLATQRKIAKAIKHPTFDVWTGNSDKTARKMSVSLAVPVSGSISSELGGLTGVVVNLTLQYSDLNQPQTITAPTNLQPYSAFQAKISSLLGEVESAVGSGGIGNPLAGAGGSSSSGAGAYTQCITKAGGDVAKMQRCSSLLSS